jgi:hypothetical protein
VQAWLFTAGGVLMSAESIRSANAASLLHSLENRQPVA